MPLKLKQQKKKSLIFFLELQIIIRFQKNRIYPIAIQFLCSLQIVDGFFIGTILRIFPGLLHMIIIRIPMVEKKASKQRQNSHCGKDCYPGDKQPFPLLRSFGRSLCALRLCILSASLFSFDLLAHA